MRQIVSKKHFDGVDDGDGGTYAQMHMPTDM